MKFSILVKWHSVLLVLLIWGAFPAYSQTAPVDYSGVIEKNRGIDPDALPGDKLYQLAAAHEELLSLEEGLSLYEKYYTRDTSQIYVLADLARVATALGRTKEAVAYLEKAVRHLPGDFYFRFKLATAYYTAGNYADASDTCNDLIDRGYYPLPVWTLLGQCSQALGLTDFALMQYEEAWRRNPGNRQTALLYLNLLMKQREYDEKYDFQALAICDSVLAYNASDTDISLAKALLLYRIKDFSAADTLFTALLERGDSSRSVIRHGGLARSQAGRHEKALPLLTLAQEMDSLDFPVVLAIASSHLGLRSYVAAEKALEEAENTLKFEDRHYTIEVLRGNLNADAGVKDKAAAHYYLAYTRYNPNSIDLLSAIYALYPYSRRMSGEAKEKSLFALYHLLDKHLGQGLPLPDAGRYAEAVDFFIEEAFFAGNESLPVRSPSGERSTVRVETLRRFSKRLKN